MNKNDFDYGEQKILDNVSKAVLDVKTDFSSLNNQTNQTEQVMANETSTDNVIKATSVFERVRTDGVSHNIVEPNQNINTFSNNITSNNQNNIAAYGNILMIVEIVSLIFLVSLITFVALRGLS